MSIMFTILGFQSILMGLIAELLVRTYHESQDKPTYTILKYLPGNQENLADAQNKPLNPPTFGEFTPSAHTETAGISG